MTATSGLKEWNTLGRGINVVTAVRPVVSWIGERIEKITPIHLFTPTISKQESPRCLEESFNFIMV